MIWNKNFLVYNINVYIIFQITIIILKLMSNVNSIINIIDQLSSRFDHKTPSEIRWALNLHFDLLLTRNLSWNDD